MSAAACARLQAALQRVRRALDAPASGAAADFRPACLELGHAWHVLKTAELGMESYAAFLRQAQSP